MSVRSIANLVALNVQTILSTAADNIFSNWMPLFLATVYQFDKGRVGWLSALPLVGGAIGGAIGGALNDWLIRRLGNLRWARSLMGLASKGAAAVLLLFGCFLLDHPYLFCGILFLVKVCSDSGLATTWGAVTDVGGRQTASVFAFNNAVAGVGSVLAPPVIGYMIEHAGWGPVFAFVAGCYALCGLSWLLINSRIPVVDESQDVNHA
jgi:ACS family hexuronate transporter-like MFS transporter